MGSIGRNVAGADLAVFAKVSLARVHALELAYVLAVEHLLH